jgi:hypothetical protein
VEQLVQLSGSSMVKRMRYLLHDDTLYTLISFIPAAIVTDQFHNEFFEQFRIRNDHSVSSILKSKAAALFEALASTDSLRFTRASEVIEQVSFEKSDLPLLHKALLGTFYDDTLSWNNARSKLIKAIEPVADSSTVDFIKANYARLADRGGDQLSLLNVLVNHKSRYAYETLKELFIRKPPADPGDRYSVSYRMTDSLELTKILYPEILTLLKNEHYWDDITDYTVRLLDSGVVTREILLPYTRDLFHIADTLLNGGTLAGEDVWSWRYSSLLELFGHINSAESNQFLQRFLKGKELYLKSVAALRLVKNSQPVDPAELEKLAANNEYRLDLYNDLKELGKASLFPAKYLTQRYFAEAELYTYASDDYSPSSMEYLGEKLAEWNGQKMRFYLFKIGFEEEEGDDPESYLGIAGPYELDPKNLETSNDATGYNADEAYNKKQVDKHFRTLLDNAEEYIKKWKNK